MSCRIRKPLLSSAPTPVPSQGWGVSNSKQFSNRLTSNSKGGPWGGEYFSLVPDHHL